MLTQRFPLMHRIDIVLIPQYRGFDGHDSGYINGDVVTSPTHEDWLKTTDEERAAKMRAQVVKCFILLIALLAVRVYYERPMLIDSLNLKLKICEIL